MLSTLFRITCHKVIMTELNQLIATGPVVFVADRDWVERRMDENSSRSLVLIPVVYIVC